MPGNTNLYNTSDVMINGVLLFLGSCGDSNPCNSPLNCTSSSSGFECLCEAGERCDEDMSACKSLDTSDLDVGIQQCERKD